MVKPTAISGQLQQTQSMQGFLHSYKRNRVALQQCLARISVVCATCHWWSAAVVAMTLADAGDRNPELLAPPSDNLYAKVTVDDIC